MKKSQIKSLDKLWSLKIKERAGYKCEYCLEEVGCLNSCHIVGRTNRATRWELENGMVLCYWHHRQYDSHGKEHELIRRMVIGQERIDRLSLLAQKTAHNQSYEEIRATLL